MLQNLKLKNWMRVAQLNLDCRSQAVFFCGPNESGKSSIAEAVRFVLMGRSPRVKLKKNYGELVTRGAKNGSVELTYDNNSVRRNIRNGAVTGDASTLPSDVEIMEVCLYDKRLALQPEKDIRSLVVRLMDVEMTVEVLAERMKRRGVDGNTIKRYRPLLLSGIKPALEKARNELSEARGAWQEVTGENYGSSKAEGWVPDEPMFDTSELEETLADIEIEVSTLKSSRDADLSETAKKIHEYEVQLVGGATFPCPDCETELVFEGNKFIVYKGPSEKRKKALALLLNTQKIKRTDIAAGYDDKIKVKEDEKRSLDAQIRAAENLTVKQARAAELHQSVKAGTEIAAMLGEGGDGIQAEIVSEAIEPLNVRLTELAAEIGWQAVTIAGDMAITRTDGISYPLLSESAQWRADMMLHTVISEMAEFPWLIFDRLDVLDLPSRNEYIRWLSQYVMVREDSVTILTMGTLKARPNLESLPGIQVHWIENGEVEILEDVA